MVLMSGKCIATHWHAACHCSVTIALLFPPICRIKDCFLTCLFVIADWLKMYKLCMCVCVCCRKQLEGEGMVLPFEPMTMTFKDLHYWVEIPKVHIRFFWHFSHQRFLR